MTDPQKSPMKLRVTYREEPRQEPVRIAEHSDAERWRLLQAQQMIEEAGLQEQ